MTGVLQSIAEHKLNIRKGYSPVRQKKRGQASERAKAIQAEVQKLMEAGIMREVGRNLEVYVDDLVIKSHTEEELLRDIEEMFRTLRKINMKLNPKKCTFRAVEGMFLGELKQHLSELPTLVAPRPQEELIMYLSASHGAVGGKTCTKKSDYCWTSDAEKSLQELKHHLSKLANDKYNRRPQEN
ncbi:reverse transcriptase domain-containing protein [Tanacetum coccineum]